MSLLLCPFALGLTTGLLQSLVNDHLQESLIPDSLQLSQFPCFNEIGGRQAQGDLNTSFSLQFLYQH